MNEDALLTVAIPTYNRSSTLEKILIQLSQEKDVPFKVLVSDDCSPDNTGDVVRGYLEDIPYLTYHRNETNLGFSGNVLNLYKMADTKYIWFLCDDETVLQGAIKRIIDAMTRHQPTVAVFNYSWMDPYDRKCFAVPQRDVVYDDRSALHDYQPLLRITFLSTLVIEKLDTNIDIPQEVYRDNVFFQLTLSLLLLSEKFKFCEMGDLIVHRNVGFKYGDFFKFYLVDVPKSVFAANHVFDNQKFLQRMRRELPVAIELYLSQKLGLFRYMQKPTRETMEKIAQFYGPYKYFIYSFKYIKMFTPTFLLKFVYWLQLVFIHGYVKGGVVYRKNINRAYTDERKTGFTEYK